MRAWWALPKAVPILLRHLLAYAELAAADLRRYRRFAAIRLLAVLVALVGAWFALAMMCIAVVALWWDTPHRMTAILSLLGLFLLLTAGALAVALSGRGEEARLFSRAGAEWAKDRVILDRLLEGEPEPAPAEPATTSPAAPASTAAPDAGRTAAPGSPQRGATGRRGAPP